MVYRTHQSFLQRDKDDEEIQSNLLKIASSICKVCDREDDAYWCFYRLLNFSQRGGSRKSSIQNQINYLGKLLELRESEINAHFKHLHANISNFSYGWFRGMFASVFLDEVPINFWDSLIGASDLYGSCIALCLLKERKSQILKCEDISSLNGYLRNLTIKSNIARSIVQKAKDLCHQENELEKLEGLNMRR
eukprot:TRINITY_DN13058_c0_g1_i2.p1 TRINITY_DN13058_c0_g1~~TRINITY_DN13058_c0_g1_i2.p1  ORF type:complete len:192 (-),score=28.78 TRINITY_DN13058_c0_g1_i2:1-576(-)